MIIFLQNITRRICFILIIFCIIASTPFEVCAQNKQVGQTYSTAYCLMDGESGRVLKDKKGEKTYANASTTKILTCIVTLENASLDEQVKVSEKAVKQPPVKLGMEVSEQYKLKDLVYAMMLESYNDCAYAVAEHVGGTEEDFAKMMNEKAKSIGCRNTNFVTPNGLDSIKGNHHTSAEDMCRIMRYCAWKSPCSKAFLQITGSLQYDFEVGGRKIHLINHNNMLKESGYISGKTGYTSKAGYCYVAAWEHKGKRIVVTLLGCGWPGNKSYKWKDTRKLIEFADTNYVRKELPAKDKAYSITLEKVYRVPCDIRNIGKKSEILLETRNGENRVKGCLLGPGEHLKEILEIDRNIEEKELSEKVGKITYMIKNDKISEINVYIPKSIKKWTFFDYIMVLLKAFA